ncbi:MAG TPA: serine/threonine-protein kinase, partial [Polyangiales bacterium]|nr:serine/threonine-protein kinase [Polyangiales bacterium]
GEGGGGTVYLALDRETGGQVALKALTHMTPLSVLRFKREFRALANIRHRNLVELYELEHADGGWFLTMEWVDGEPFLTGLDDMTDDSLAANRARERDIFQRFRQLAEGVQAIHQAGMVHCDLKPSNVLLERGGRVVVLDFGLVRELSTSAADTVDGTTAGTPAYMPPEQARGEELSAASDWYAFGTMLYEALSGVLPIEGRSAVQLIQRKLHEDAPSLPHDAAPRSVRKLCQRLLQRNPRERADGQEVLQVLSELAEPAVHPDEVGSVTSEYNTATTELLVPDTQTGQTQAELFGRAAEILQLEAALAHCRETHSSMCQHVCAPSGAGKTTLVEHFLSESAQLHQLLVLRCRCYERETIAFKSIDGIVDALVKYLLTLHEVDLAHVLPKDLAALTALFPAFERIPTV